MTVRELIELLESMPQDYHVIYESGDRYGSAYYAYVSDVTVNDKKKIIELLGD